MIPAICLLGFLGSFLLLYFAGRVNPANRYLAYHFFLNSLFGMAYWAIIISDSDTLRAIFAIHYFPFYLLNTPFLYFYVRALLTDKIQIKGWDYLIFLPFIVVLINFIPFSLLPWPLKLDFAYQFHQNVNYLNRIEFPLLTLTEYILFRAVFSLLFVAMAASIVRKSIRKKVLDPSHSLLIWLIICLATSAIINLFMIINSVQSLLNHNLFLVQFESGQGRIGITLVLSTLIFSIFFFPKFLYGMNLTTGTVSLSNVLELNKSMSSKSTDISTTRLAQIDRLLINYLPAKRYLTPGFSLADLVKDLDVPLHVLSIYFNNYKGTTFVVWKNQLRIEEAIQLMKSGKADAHTLESVGEACGYKSRSNFIQAFKVQMGESPSGYLKRIG